MRENGRTIWVDLAGMMLSKGKNHQLCQRVVKIQFNHKPKRYEASNCEDDLSPRTCFVVLKSRHIIPLIRRNSNPTTPYTITGSGVKTPRSGFHAQAFVIVYLGR